MVYNTTTEVILPILASYDVMGVGLSFFAIAFSIGLGLGFFKSVQDTVGIFIVTQVIFLVLGFTTMTWLILLASVIYGMMVINNDEN